MVSKIYILLSVVILGILLTAGCTSMDDQSSAVTQSITKAPSATSKTTTTVSNINQDFSSMALTINDLPNGWMTSGEPTKNATFFEANFVYIGGSTGIPMAFTITKYPSVNNAKTAFSQMKSAITTVRVDSLNIGDEGFGYQNVADSEVKFRRGNLIISISAISYPAVKISLLQPYAELVNSRIKG